MFNFREIIELWRSDNLMTQALNDSHAALESTRDMYHESIRSLRRDDGEMKINVYDMDQRINKYEKEVRRKVFKHLAITGGTNVIPGLILTSIIIDIERVGDYTKNIMDLAVAHPRILECGVFDEDLKKIEKDVGKLFDEIIPALKTTDKKTAVRLIEESWWMLKKCDEILTALIQERDPSLSPGNAVSTGIYARYLKRITAHLINVATSVVSPFERIGFRLEKD
jgi:phosphate transport system protein